MSDENNSSIDEGTIAPEVQALIDKAVSESNVERDQQIQQLTDQNQAQQDKNGELLSEYKTFKERFDGIDPEKITGLLEVQRKLESDEEGRLIADGKIDEVFNKRNERLLLKHQGDLSERDDIISGLKEENAQLRNDIAGLRIDDAVKAAMINAVPATDSAIEDAVLRARTVWQLGKDGQPEARTPDGSLMKGMNRDALSIGEWVENCRVTNPHWFKQAKGGGAKGNNSGNITGLKRSQMSSAEKSSFVSQHGQEAFKRLPL